LSQPLVVIAFCASMFHQPGVQKMPMLSKGDLEAKQNGHQALLQPRPAPVVKRPLVAVFFVATFLFVGVVVHFMFGSSRLGSVALGTEACSEALLENIVANDLWAIHDLLLVGYSAVFLNTTQSKQEVQGHAYELAKLLPHLHPHKPCRHEIARAMNSAGDERSSVVAAAEAAWACLPAKFSYRSFNNPFTEEGLDDFTKAKSARMPVPKDTDQLCACRGSKWPRACSYWASLHTMAYRADALLRGKEFLRSVVPIIISGALQCGGCTRHFRMLEQEDLFSPAMAEGFGNVY